MAETVDIKFLNKFYHFAKGKGLTSFNEDNSTHFSGEKKYNEAFGGFYFLRILVVVLDHESKGLY